MKQAFILLPSFLILFSCSSKRLTVEDVEKKVDLAQEANFEAKAKNKEAIQARIQLTEDYKAVEIEKIERRIKEIDKKIKSLSKSNKDSANKTVTSSLNTAISALENEKANLTESKNRIDKIQSLNWDDNLEIIDSSYTILNDNLDEVNNSFNYLKK